MPHAIDRDDEQDAEDNRLISSLLNAEATGEGQNLDFMSRELELGEKADDAQDYEDIGDDDLADEEDALPGLNGHAQPDEDWGDLFNSEGNEVQETVEGDDNLDALFGGGEGPSSPVAEHHQVEAPAKTNGHAAVNGHPRPSFQLALPGQHQQQRDHDDESLPDADSPLASDQPEFRDVDYGTVDDDPEWEEQRKLFAQSRKHREDRERGQPAWDDLPEPPQTNAELFDLVWPDFERDKPLNFQELLPQKRAFYVAKTPIKPPRPVQPTKVTLELAQDTERSFRLPGTATLNKQVRQTEAEQHGIILANDGDAGRQSSDEEIELDHLSDSEEVGGVSWNDLNILCADWDIASEQSILVNGFDADADGDIMLADHNLMDQGCLSPSTKRKFIEFDLDTAFTQAAVFPSFDDPERETAKLAKKVRLDMNDPLLLIDIQEPSVVPTKRRKLVDPKRDGSKTMTKDLTRRYNISNDEAYDALKENHQHKVRSTIGNLAVDHALPAVKLQYPFYKVKLSNREARSFHRPSIYFTPQQTVRFSKPKFIKKKHQKGKETHMLFEKAVDLSFGDNSHMMLLEHTEEYPLMLPNFGMGNRLINYYRRKDDEDTSRPKFDLGETQVLMPQDKSPFSIFGNVEPGQSTPTIHNSMYRAPVFKHDPKNTDFLVARSTTGINGSVWYMRNIENLFVAGQQLPSVEIPGPHARKVTDAAKKRLKMLSYRIWKRNRAMNIKNMPLLSNQVIQQHLPGSDIPSNRSKMKDFMVYDKETSSWMPRKGEVLPDEPTIRSLLRPEDICLIDSMQVGVRHLQDSGYTEDLQDVDDEQDVEGTSVEKKMAPWKLTKTFLEACQGKAMVELHGEGDPSGRGEAFSFIRISMKGGFKNIGESVEDRLDAERLKEQGGHKYNVAKQQKQYEELIKTIWNRQGMSLSSTIDHSDHEMDVDDELPAAPVRAGTRAATPRSGLGGTPSIARGRDDDSASQFSKFSAGDDHKVLRITRTTTDEDGQQVKREEVVHDPKVIREYMRRKRAQEIASLNLHELAPTGDTEADERARKRIEAELTRLERNKERRFAREKAKAGAAGSPGGPESPSAGGAGAEGGGKGKGAGTQRKCANCGQVGHIKTNKKLCPMLNGTMKQEEGFGSDAAFGNLSTPL